MGSGGRSGKVGWSMGRDFVYTFGNVHALPCVSAVFNIADHRLMSCIIRILPNPDRNSRSASIRITQSCLYELVQYGFVKYNVLLWFSQLQTIGYFNILMMH